MTLLHPLTKIFSPLAGAEASPCPEKWMFFGGSCYALFENPLSWNDAEVRSYSWNIAVCSTTKKILKVFS